MRESTSPPRTPTPRSGNLTPSPSNLSSDSRSESRIPSSSPIPVQSLAVPHQSTMFASNGSISVSQLDLEFPKLTPPKSKSPRNSNNNTITINNNSNSTNNNRDSDRPSSENGNITSTVLIPQRVMDIKAATYQNVSPASIKKNSTFNISNSPSAVANAAQEMDSKGDSDNETSLDNSRDKDTGSPCDRYSPVIVETNDKDGFASGTCDLNGPRNRNNSTSKGSRSRIKNVGNLNSNDGNYNIGSRSRGTLNPLIYYIRSLSQGIK